MTKRKGPRLLDQEGFIEEVTFGLSVKDRPYSDKGDTLQRDAVGKSSIWMLAEESGLFSKGL